MSFESINSASLLESELGDYFEETLEKLSTWDKELHSVISTLDDEEEKELSLVLNKGSLPFGAFASREPAEVQTIVKVSNKWKVLDGDYKENLTKKL